MEATSSSTSIFKNPNTWALFATLAVLCVLDGWLGYGREGLFTRTARQRAADIVTQPSPSIQIFGDSVSDGALDETVLERGLEKMAAGGLQNYSIPGTTAYCAYPLLKRQVSAGKVPKVIILAYNPRSYSVPLTEKFLGRFATWGEIAEAGSLGVPLETWLQAAVCRASFTMRYRPELNTIVRTGEGWDFFDPQKTPVETLAQRRLRMAAPVTQGAGAKVARDFNPEFHNSPFRRSVEIDKSLAAFFALAKQCSIQVFIVSMPDPPGAHAYRESNGFNRAYAAFLENLAERYGAKLLWPQIEVYPASDFLDGVHLTRLAGKNFSAKLHERLLADPAASLR